MVRRESTIEGLPNNLLSRLALSLRRRAAAAAPAPARVATPARRRRDSRAASSPPAAARAMAALQRGLNSLINERDARTGLPRYPILRYMSGEQDADDAPAPQTPTTPAPATPSTPQSYGDALALNAFMSEFVALLRKGFGVIRRDGRGRGAVYVLSLSPDCRELRWAPRRPGSVSHASAVLAPASL